MSTPLEKIATDIYSFPELRNGGFTYVDKTDMLCTMASGDVGKQFFIALHALLKKRINLIGISFSFEKRTIVEDLVGRHETVYDIINNHKKIAKIFPKVF